MPLAVELLCPSDRQKFMVETHLAKQAEYMTRKGRCDYCALTVGFCVCSQLDELRFNTVGRVAVLMNTKEKYRSSNTAKIIERILNANLLISGVDDAELNQIVAQGNCFVLFPSEGALTWEEAKLPGDNRTIIVLDGTWRQARRLNQAIPLHVPRIKVSPTSLSQFLCRRQTNPDRVCTVEALSMLYKDMGRDAESVQLERGLGVLLEGFNKQCFGSTHRPNTMLKKAPQGTVLPPRHPSSLIEAGDTRELAEKAEVLRRARKTERRRLRREVDLDIVS